MAKYNIYGHVLYSEIEYERLMYTTERIFINALMNRIGGIKQWTDDIWNNIDHEYMINTLREIKRDVLKGDYDTFLKFKGTTIDIENLFEQLEEMLKQTDMIPDLYKINSIETFREYERRYGDRVAMMYQSKLKMLENNDLDETTFLTNQIKEFHKIEDFKTYKGVPPRHVNISTYLSMLYNVNITRTGWNQTFKDAEYFEKDLVLLETHPRSCPKCAPKQGKVYSRSGKSKRYEPIEEAYDNGIGHPNCKCEFSIFWDPIQLKTQYLSATTGDEYEVDQKKKATERAIRRAENDMNLYNMIGNGEMVDKTLKKIERLRDKLVS